MATKQFAGRVDNTGECCLISDSNVVGNCYVEWQNAFHLSEVNPFQECADWQNCSVSSREEDAVEPSCVDSTESQNFKLCSNEAIGSLSFLVEIGFIFQIVKSSGHYWPSSAPPQWRASAEKEEEPSSPLKDAKVETPAADSDRILRTGIIVRWKTKL